MIKKIKSIIDGNNLDVIKLKIKNKLRSRSLIYNRNIDVLNYKEIPIIINNRNRLFFLIKLIDYLEENDYKNIIILDNQSTYLPLIDFYKKTKYKVIRLQKNFGYLSLWKSSFFKDKIRKNYYVYTDPDVLPILETPKDFLNYFKDCLGAYSKLDKVGFGIKIDDLPNSNLSSKDIIENESKFWKKKINANLFLAPIDTTFALYRPYSFGGYWINSARTNYPYLTRHLPWYNEKIEKEEIFYKKNIKKNSSFYVSKRYEKY